MLYIRQVAIFVRVSLTAVCVLVATAFGASLVFPTRSQSLANLDFVSSIPLPKAPGVPNVVDYLTVNQQSLFVTSESSGTAYKVPIAVERLPAALCGLCQPIHPASLGGI